MERMSAREGDMSASIIQGIVVLCCECLWEERRRRGIVGERERRERLGGAKKSSTKRCLTERHAKYDHCNL